MISIIIPVYKVELYIRNCLQSVLNQTYKDYEVILIDDGSPDACGKICDEYAEKRPNWNVVHQPNAGQAAARNAGLSIAKGDYICFIDSDDSVDYNYLKELYHALIETNSDLAICGYQRINESTKIARECFKTIKITKARYKQGKRQHENKEPSSHSAWKNACGS